MQRNEILVVFIQMAPVHSIFHIELCWEINKRWRCSCWKSSISGTPLYLVMIGRGKNVGFVHIASWSGVPISTVIMMSASVILRLNSPIVWSKFISHKISPLFTMSQIPATPQKVAMDKTYFTFIWWDQCETTDLPSFEIFKLSRTLQENLNDHYSHNLNYFEFQWQISSLTSIRIKKQ